MTSIEDQVRQIDKSIEEARKTVSFGDSLARLYSNRDFIKVILQGFFAEEAIRLVHLKGDQNMQSPEKQKAILTQMDAIGALKDYFNTVEFKSNLAKKSIGFDEQTREELIQGDDNGN